jgi:hypothetical protein
LHIKTKGPYKLHKVGPSARFTPRRKQLVWREREREEWRRGIEEKREEGEEGWKKNRRVMEAGDEKWKRRRGIEEKGKNKEWSRKEGEREMEEEWRASGGEGISARLEVDIPDQTNCASPIMASGPIITQCQ